VFESVRSVRLLQLQRLLQKKLGFAFPLFHGRGVCVGVFVCVCVCVCECVCVCNVYVDLFVDVYIQACVFMQMYM